MQRNTRNTRDPSAKMWMKQKWLLASAARAVIPAFSKYEVQYIIDHCMPKPWQEHVPLDGSGPVLLLQQESIAAEGIVEYDLMTELYDPATGMRYRIDLEGENWDTGKRLQARQEFYAARLIAGQKGDVFQNDRYEDMIPVWSIWLHFNPKQQARIERTSIGKYIHFATIYLGDGILKTEESKEVQEMFMAMDTAFSRQYTAQEKIDRIEQSLRIRMIQEEKEMIIREDPLAERLWDQGMEKGIEKGRQEGRKEGRQEGRKEGKEDNERSMVQTMLRKGILSAEQIADTFSIPLQRVKQIQESL